MSDTPKPAPARRRIQRDPVVPMWHVEDRPPGGKVEDGERSRDRAFGSKAEADAWAEARHRARNHVARKRPELSAKRAETAAFEIAEALLECAEFSSEDEGDSPSGAAENSATAERETTPSAPGFSNGAGAHHA